MGRKIAKVAAVVLAGIALAIAGLVGWTYYAWDRHFSAPYPAIRAVQIEEVISRGRYLAYGPAHCAGCHVAPENQGQLEAAGEPPLSGGFKFPLGPLGAIWTPNLTPDKETGIGKRTDEELARVIRYDVHADGRALLPFMEYQTISDADLVALISFLRSQPAVSNAVPPIDPTVTLVTPNLTPDPETGRIAKWSEGTFVARFRVGKAG